VELRKFWNKIACIHKGKHGFREIYYVELRKFWDKNDWLYEG